LERIRTQNWGYELELKSQENSKLEVGVRNCNPSFEIPKLGLKLKNWNPTFDENIRVIFDHVLNFELSREIMKVLPPL
jgi:hypothetical protein